jgi:hypothetical protein
MSKNKYLIIILLFKLLPAHAQENIGIANSNYSPTNSVLLNPSSIADSKVFWEINVVGISTFIDNNLFYLPKNEFSLVGSIKNPESTSEPSNKDNTSNKHGYIDAAVHGPSAIFTLGKHAFGFNTQVRSITDIRNLPDHLAKFSIEGFSYLPQRGITYSGSNIKINTMAWGEVGLNYAYIFKQEQTNMYIGGVSLKKLIGISHLGVNIDEVSYMVPDTLDVDFFNAKGKYGFTVPAFNSGGGWSIDLGFTYKKSLDIIDHYTPYSRESNCKKSEYKYKIGVSLLDLGWITYHNESHYGEIEDVPGLWQNYNATQYGDAVENDTKIIESFIDVKNQKDKYRTYLPTALSVQFDYNFENGFYLNGTVVQNLSFFNKLGVNRQNLLAITPRYEMSRLEVSMPFSMRRYTSPSIGLAVRLWNNIIIGTDRIGPLLFNVDVYGMDIYCNLKLARIYSRKCKSKRVASKYNTYRTNDCYYKPRKKKKDK